jgi:glycosidase
VRTTHPDAWFEAEVIHGDYARFVAESAVDTVTQYELWKAIWSSLESSNFWELDWALRRHTEMLATFAPATFVGNHDVTRIASQVSDRRHLPHAVVLLALLGGTPTVYAGDEFGLPGLKEERLGGDDAIRPPFPAGGPADLAGRDDELFRLHQLLLGLRRRHAWLHRATPTTDELSNLRYAVTLTGGDGERLTMQLNLDDAPMPAVAGELLAADPQTAAGGPDVAPHGWRVASVSPTA